MYLDFTLTVLHALKTKILIKKRNKLTFCNLLVKTILTSIEEIYLRKSLTTK